MLNYNFPLVKLSWQGYAIPLPLNSTFEKEG